MKLAAVDIGSNAIRLQISNVIDYKGNVNFKKLEYVRFPLRLGHDVFSFHKIGDQNRKKFMKLMNAFQLLIELYEVDDYMICATSAMREAENGKEIAKKVKRKFDLNIKIISGRKEASLINKAIFTSLDPNETYLHIDVGGGSTELNLIENLKKIATQSFKIGSVRRLEHHESPLVLESMHSWIEHNVIGHTERITAIGTGGNINKIFEMAGAKPGRTITDKKVKQVMDHIASFPLEERINVLQLNPDRADVIIPASEIYLSVMKWSKSRRIMVPDVGLKDGMLMELYERNSLQGRLFD